MILRTSNMLRRNSGSRPASVSQASIVRDQGAATPDRGRTTVPRLDRDSTRPLGGEDLASPPGSPVRLTPSIRLSSPCSGKDLAAGQLAADDPPPDAVRPRRRGCRPVAAAITSLQWA